MNPHRIAELRSSIPHDEDFNVIRAEFDRGVELALDRLECVARGTMSADEAFPPTERERAFARMIAADIAKLPFRIVRRSA